VTPYKHPKITLLVSIYTYSDHTTPKDIPAIAPVDKALEVVISPLIGGYL
jgi:hypothetical protein